MSTDKQAGNAADNHEPPARLVADRGGASGEGPARPGPAIGLLRALAPYWVAVLAADGLAAWACGSPLGSVLAHQLLLVAVFRAWHWALHRPGSGRLARLHGVHHQALYPPERLTSAGYRSEGGFAQELALLLAMAAALGGSWVLGTGAHTLAVNAGGYGLALLAGSSLHQAMHVDGHWLLRWRWFRDMRALHWLHHVDQGCNLGIVDALLDALAGTLRRR